MYVDYNDLSEDARVWVYPSSRKFYPQEVEGLNDQLLNFAKQWKSAEENNKVSFQFLHDRFIVFLLDENAILSNSDLDQQVAFVLRLQQEYEIDLLDKMNVCFKQGEFIQYKDVKEFKKLIKNRSVSKSTIVFDNLIQTKFDLENYWEVPITDSWYNRFL